MKMDRWLPLRCLWFTLLARFNYLPFRINLPIIPGINRLPIHTRAPTGPLGACPQQGYGAQYEKAQNYLICDFDRFCAPTFHARNNTLRKSVMPRFFTALFSLSCKAIVDTQFKLFNQNPLHEAGCGNSHAERLENAPRLRRGWRAIDRCEPIGRVRIIKLLSCAQFPQCCLCNGKLRHSFFHADPKGGRESLDDQNQPPNS